MFKYRECIRLSKKGTLKRKYLNAKQSLISNLFTVFADFKFNSREIIKKTKKRLNCELIFCFAADTIITVSEEKLKKDLILWFAIMLQFRKHITVTQYIQCKY